MNWKKIVEAYQQGKSCGLSPKQKVYLEKYKAYLERKNIKEPRWRVRDRRDELYPYRIGDKLFWGRIVKGDLFHLHSREISHMYAVLCNNLDKPYDISVQEEETYKWFGKKAFKQYRDIVYLFVNKNNIKYYLNKRYLDTIFIEKDKKLYTLTVDVSHHRKQPLSVIEQRLYVSDIPSKTLLYATTIDNLYALEQDYRKKEVK